jgi:starch-binding outer membrane protein, SusD/RagB family
MKKAHHSILLLSILFSVLSCKKLVEINSPGGEITTDKVFESDQTANAVIAAIYAKLSGTSAGVYPTTLAGLSSDELLGFTASYIAFQNNTILPNDASNNLIWSLYYNIIYETNSLIEGLQNSKGVSAALQLQLTAEAKFLRALCYFELVNLYGDIPLVTSTNINVNVHAARVAVTQVYQQIMADLKDVQAVLPDNYAGADRARANKTAATALLARVYLYTQNWTDAEIQASLVINSMQYHLNDNLTRVFVKNSSETIFQLWSGNGFTLLGSNIIGGSNPVFAFTSDFVNAFEPGDIRQTSWLKSTDFAGGTYYYPYKYKLNVNNTSDTAEHLVVLRLGEQYLIRAEARINNSKISEGVDDLNILRSRARAAATALVPDPLPALSTTLSFEEAKLAVEQERRIELCAEMGHRWLDLKRTGRVNEVMIAFKPANWKSSSALYPIPLKEINANNQLTQNPGYSQ